MPSVPKFAERALLNSDLDISVCMQIRALLKQDMNASDVPVSRRASQQEFDEYQEKNGPWYSSHLDDQLGIEIEDLSMPRYGSQLIEDLADKALRDKV